MNRRLAPEATLARVAALAPAIGVTRLAVLTGLDVIGIPVAAAVRPNSRTVAVHQGKGDSLAAAKVSALMEALECCCAETAMLPAHFASAAELAAIGAFADPLRLPRCRGGPDPLHERLLWVEARELGSGRPVWAPRELVTADYSLPQAAAARVFQATTTGLASGNTSEEALLHGLCEAVERDAMTLWHAASETAQARTLVDPDSVDGPCSRAFLDLCRAAGVEVTIWETTSDVGVPVFAALLTDPLGQVQPELGAACRTHPDAALAAALAEAAQARLTTISGARDDLPPEAFAHRAVQARLATALAWRGAAPARRFADAAAVPGSDVPDSDPVAAVLRRLAQAGMAQALAVDLTRPDLGVPVVRVLVPGLEGAWSEADGEFSPGVRARRVLGAA